MGTGSVCVGGIKSFFCEANVKIQRANSDSRNVSDKDITVFRIQTWLSDIPITEYRIQVQGRSATRD